jgi:hypothetical protein
MWWKRSDGDLVRGLSDTRRVMPYLMRGRNESAVYSESDLSLPRADAFIREWNQANPLRRIDVFHLAAWALRDALERNPTLNRFVAGGRIYQRRGIWFSYAVKTKLVTGAPMVVVKRRFDTDVSFAAMVEQMYDEQAEFLSDDAGRVDKELGLLMKFPGFARRIIMAAVRGADRLGMLPRGYIENDPMYASAFFANLASIGMPAVYHHLYEYGTVGIFCALGRPITEADGPTSGPDRRRTMIVRWTFDERTEDGLSAWFAFRRFKQVLEDPEGAGLAVIERVDAGAVDTTTTVPLENPVLPDTASGRLGG